MNPADGGGDSSFRTTPPVFFFLPVSLFFYRPSSQRLLRAPRAGMGPTYDKKTKSKARTEAGVFEKFGLPHAGF